VHNFTVLGFVAHLTHMIAEIPEMGHRLLEELAHEVHREAISGMGNYKFGFPRLSPAAIAKKATGDSPLVETGALRSNVRYNVSAPLAWVGTDDMKGVWNFLGTSRGIPPRDPIKGAVEQSGPAIVHRVGANFAAWIGGDGLPRRQLR
jgi:hypothetical protein